MIKVGEINQRVIDLLKLNIEAGTPIFMGKSNIEHMIQSHPSDYEAYSQSIPDIIETPDYIGVNPKDKSIEYVKVFIIQNESVKVAVRVSHGGLYYARTIYARDITKMERFISKGYLIKY